jgi:protein-disulfide isomerase
MKMSNKVFKVIMIIIALVVAFCVTLAVMVSCAGKKPEANSGLGGKAAVDTSKSIAADYKPRNDYATQLSPKSPVWNPKMTLGSDNAQNHFIEYTDMFCPYCAKFNLALHSNFDAFKRDYIDTGKIQFEVRLVSMITTHRNSDYGEQYAYCAAEQNKFWDYYPKQLKLIDDKYFSKGIGGHGQPDIEDLPMSFFENVAKDSGVDMTKLKSCIDSGKGKSGVGVATATAQRKLPSGVPYFIFNDFTNSGFEGDYNTIKQMFTAGGVN